MQLMNWKGPLQKQPCAAPFVEQLLSYSTPIKLKRIYHKEIKEKKLNDFFHMCRLVVTQGVKFKQN